METPVLLLLSRDLLAVGRVEAVAASAGWSVLVQDPKSDSGRDATPELIVVDLDSVGEQGLSNIELRGRTVGFFSHVDESLGRAAEQAGIEVWPRGRFWRELPTILELPRR